jgi:hypothetical protein
MTAIKRASLAIWDFIVGDDWRVALGVAVAIAVTALIAPRTPTAWLLLPVAVVALLADSLRRAARSSWDDRRPAGAARATAASELHKHSDHMDGDPSGPWCR